MNGISDIRAKELSYMSNYNDSVPIKPNLTSSYKSSSIDRSRPLNAPKSRKDFNKIIDKSDLEENEKEEVAEVDEKEKPLPSLFELSGKDKVKKPVLKSVPNKPLTPNSKAVMDPDVDLGKEELVDLNGETTQNVPNTETPLASRRRFEIPSSPFSESDEDMIALSDQPPTNTTQVPTPETKMAQPLKTPSNPSEEVTSGKESIPIPQENKSAPQPPLKKAVEDVSGREELVRGEGLHVQMEEPKDKTKLGRLSTEDPNLQGERGQTQFAYLSSLSNQQQLNADTGKTKTAHVDISRSIAIRELIEKVVQSIQTIKKKDITETVVTLRFPPILEGAKLKLTAFDHAKNEFNISFSELSAAGKDFLDRKMAKDSLLDALDQKGFTVHILSTTTQQDISFNSNFENLSRERREQQQQQERQQGQGNQKWQQQESNEEEE